jgi:hypothetical protein
MQMIHRYSGATVTWLSCLLGVVYLALSSAAQGADSLDVELEYALATLARNSSSPRELEVAFASVESRQVTEEPGIWRKILANTHAERKLRTRLVFACFKRHTRKGMSITRVEGLEALAIGGETDVLWYDVTHAEALPNGMRKCDVVLRYQTPFMSPHGSAVYLGFRQGRLLLTSIAEGRDR